MDARPQVATVIEVRASPVPRRCRGPMKEAQLVTDLAPARQDLAASPLGEPSTVDPLAELVARACAGDLDACAQVYDATADRVYGLALNILGDEDLAADVTVATYAEVWHGSPAFRPGPGRAASWIIATAHRLAVAQVRTGGSSVPVAAPAPGALLAHLPDEVQETVHLAYFGGRSCTEVARTTGTSGDVVAGRLGSALRSLRTADARLPGSTAGPV